MKKLIAIAAKKGRGKDTAANYLAANYGFMVDHFAKPLKIVTMEVFGLTLDEVTDPVLKETVLTRWPYEAPGRLLQLVGTDLFRERWPDVWVRAAMRRAAQYDRTVLTDCRFPNEAAAVQTAGGVVIRLTGPCWGVAGGRDPNHASERMVEDIIADFEIDNTATKDQLYTQLDEIMLTLSIPKIECWTPGCMR
jgi:hypothetical protein